MATAVTESNAGDNRSASTTKPIAKQETAGTASSFDRSSPSSCNNKGATTTFDRSTKKDGKVRTNGDNPDEGVEVVLDHGSTKVMDRPPSTAAVAAAVGPKAAAISSSSSKSPTTASKSTPPSSHTHSHSHRPTPDQNVFRVPHAVRPRPGRPPAHYPGGRPHSTRSHPPPPHLQGSGSFSYAPSGEYLPPRPYPVPTYNPSGSFDDGYQNHSHYSPQVQYPQPGSGGRYPDQDVNVISPNHKNHKNSSTSTGGPSGNGSGPKAGGSDHPPHHGAKYRPPPISNPRARSVSGAGAHPGPPPPPGHHYYQYPPTSPVSRPGGAHPAHSPPRLRNFNVRRGDGPYSKAQRSSVNDSRDRRGTSSTSEKHPDDGTWNPFPAPSRTRSVETNPHNSHTHHPHRPQPPLVTESSFDSDHYSGSHYSHPSHPPTPGSHAHPPTPGSHAHPPTPRSHLPPHHHDSHHSFYSNGAGSWGTGGSFDSSAPPPQHYDDYRAHSYHSPDSPYSSQSPYSPYPPYSSGSYYSDPYAPHRQGYGPPSHSYDEDERGLLKNYNPDRDGEDSHHHHHGPGAHIVSLNDPKKRGGNDSSADKSSNGITLPKAAQEVDFEVADPPMEPVTPPSTEPICESLAEVNSFDVLCGRGGGTNSQIGNKRFRKLVQEFQPTYLLARRKEKPLLARTIVLIIRKRGGHFLRKDDDTGMLYEVGDAKAEAKTSQALREGLDVRATKSAANSVLDKNKKKKKKGKANATASAVASSSIGASGTATKPNTVKEEDSTNTALKNNGTTIVKPSSTPVPTSNGTGDSTSATSPKDAKRPSGTSAPATATATSTPTTAASSTATPNATEPVPATPPPKSDAQEVNVVDSPPVLPRLQDEDGTSGGLPPATAIKVGAGMVHPHSPEALQFRKRRRMRVPNCTADKFFPDFCPPRADLARTGSPLMCSAGQEVADLSASSSHGDFYHTPDHHHREYRGHHSSRHYGGGRQDPHHRAPYGSHHRGGHDGPSRYETDHIPAPGCADIALDIMTGGATQGFCLGPTKWK